MNRRYEVRSNSEEINFEEDICEMKYRNQLELWRNKSDKNENTRENRSQK